MLLVGQQGETRTNDTFVVGMFAETLISIWLENCLCRLPTALHYVAREAEWEQTIAGSS